jgi:hypothetical protein
MRTQFFGNVLSRSLAACTVLAMAAIMVPAHATELVTNGSFETVTGAGVSAEIGTLGTENVSGWTTSGYNFVFTPGTADNGTGAIQGGGHLQLWGAGNGGAAGNNLGVSPDGGNFVAMDGAYETAAISQTITGLVAGDQYTVSFYYAGAQQKGYTGDTTEAVKVSFGGHTIETPVLSDPSHNFTGWYSESMTFTANSTSDVLSFLAVGTPSGQPPFTLLDGVSVTADTSGSPVPEPSSLALLLTGFAGVGGYVRSRFKKA